MAAGSTVTVIVAGVVPEAGETVSPGCAAEMEKSVEPPPASVMVNVCASTFRLQ